ncbi:DNA alkylation repair protein [Mucilaginibacter sp. SMC90]|uniref:DNA alkylation repair protein n=1 Tax=Mucilaginibacter sp. SMC90 TaxID=2929803 RepID=UPI001FB1E8A7|nr:DNA alkylation repair protein [Mucilaginibacter sp. SMC90]UOE47666.1 DNA alkylation repair protein [Mucilaginibacter sp. SMC90]
MDTVQFVLEQLKEKADAAYLKGMARFGIDNSQALGVKLPEIRKLAKIIKTDHALALALWGTRVHEARMLASLIADPKQVTPELMDSWTRDFNSWDICDQVCGNLFDRTVFAIDKAVEYSSHEQEFVKRAGFVLMAEYAIHNKTAPDSVFIKLFPIMEREAWDNRNFVKKAINWALRQIGKRNNILKVKAINTARNIYNQPAKSAKWIAKNALDELISK